MRLSTPTLRAGANWRQKDRGVPLKLSRQTYAAVVATFATGFAVVVGVSPASAAHVSGSAPAAAASPNVSFQQYELAAQNAQDLKRALESARRGGKPAARDTDSSSAVKDNRHKQSVYVASDGKVVDKNGKILPVPRPPAIAGDRYAAASDAADAAAGVEPPSNYEYCTANDASYTSLGYAYDRFFLCKVGGYLFTKTVIVNGVAKEVGRVSIRLTTIVRFSRNSRLITVGNRVDQVQQTGDYARDTSTIMNVSYDCIVSSLTSCSGTSGQGRGIGQWITNPYLDQTFTPSTGSGLDARGLARARGRVSVAGAGAVKTVFGPSNQLRCDTATYVPGGTRCLMPNVLPVLSYSTSDSAVNEAARHIFEAQVTPERVVPAAGQSIPGRVEGPWLHRIYYDTAKRDANRAAAVRQCVASNGSGYTQGGVKSCDEYPFASTAEGAANGNTRWSARVITATDNSTAGSRLGAFYGQQAVLDGDSLAVNITS